MRTIRWRGMSVAGAVLLCAGAAQSQCTWFVDGVPDFDQRRSPLPGDGGMYCVPTAYTNWFAYYANRGSPQPQILDGPREWQDQANYNLVTDALEYMGGLMQTDATGGTGQKRGVNGAWAYQFLHARNDYVIGSASAWEGDVISPAYLQKVHQLGGHMVGIYGRYSDSSGWVRDGGHAWSIRGVWEPTCGVSAPIIEFSDPWTSDLDAQQSTFRTSLAVLTPVTRQFKRSSDGDWTELTMYRMDKEGPTSAHLDTLGVILPMSAIFPGVGARAGTLNVLRPFRPAGSLSPETQTFQTPAGTGTVLDVATGADPLASYYLTGDGSVLPGVWKLDLVTGQNTRKVTLSDPGPMAISRFNELYVIDGGTVERYDLSTTPATLLGSITPTFRPVSIACDDKSDAVVVITEQPTIGPRRMYRYSRNLGPFFIQYTLPLSLDGGVLLDVDAETAGRYWVAEANGNTLYQLEAQGSSLVQVDSIVHPNGRINGLNVLDGNRLVYAVTGVLVEKFKSPTLGWMNVIGSRWAGRDLDSPRFSLARSRSKMPTALEDNPAWRNISDPIQFRQLPACYANCDDSTISPVLNVLDFNCFINRFAARDVYANCDNSTSAPQLNVLDFNCYINRFSQGCP